MQDISFSTKRLLLRNIQLEDEGFLLSLYRNPQVSASYVCESLQNEEILHKFVTKMKDMEYDGKTFFWIVEYSGKAIGTFNTFVSHDDSSTIEIGYCIDPMYWNQGFASEALVGTINYLKEHTSFHKIQCSHFLFNPASQRVMEKAGMIFEGIRRDVFYFKDKYQSLGYYYSIKE